MCSSTTWTCLGNITSNQTSNWYKYNYIHCRYKDTNAIDWDRITLSRRQESVEAQKHLESLVDVLCLTIISFSLPHIKFPLGKFCANFTLISLGRLLVDHLKEHLVEVALTRPQLIYRPEQVRSGEDRWTPVGSGGVRRGQVRAR